jgi:hypothetical protein
MAASQEKAVCVDWFCTTVSVQWNFCVNFKKDVWSARNGDNIEVYWQWKIFCFMLHLITCITCVPSPASVVLFFAQGHSGPACCYSLKIHLTDSPSLKIKQVLEIKIRILLFFLVLPWSSLLTSQFYLAWQADVMGKFPYSPVLDNITSFSKHFHETSSINIRSVLVILQCWLMNVYRTFLKSPEKNLLSRVDSHIAT